MHGAADAPTDGAIRLLVADDDPIIRLTLSALIERESDFALVGTAEDADQAIAVTVSGRW